MSTMNQPEVALAMTPAAAVEVKKFMAAENVGPEAGGLRVSVQPDFVASAMKANDIVDTGAGPIAGPFVHEAASNIESSPCIVVIKNCGADRGCAFGNIIESEADHRCFVWPSKRSGTQMPGQSVAGTRFYFRPRCVHVACCFRKSDQNHPRGGCFPPRVIGLPLDHLPIASRKRHSSLCITVIVPVYRLGGFDA